MNIRLSHKRIKEMCGTVSFKRGASFFHDDKVIFELYTAHRCEALVKGAEQFHVTIDTNVNGEIHTSCSCPKLVSFDQDCQHIAAVLLSIYEHQRMGTRPNIPSSSNQGLGKDLLSLFQEQPKWSSRHQLHFEKREVLALTILCKPVEIEKGQHLLSIELEIGSVKVENIRFFLEQLRTGNTCMLSSSFIYDPAMHCFLEETDAVLRELIQVAADEKMYAVSKQEKDRMLIPPSTWKNLVPLLMKAPLVEIEEKGKRFEHFKLTEKSLPLQFYFINEKGNDYQLKIKSLERIIVLDSYHCVLFNGEIRNLKEEECNRLSNLKQMLISSGTDKISIPEQEIGYFLEKLVPGFKKLGEVTISQSLSKKFMRTPLVAKLYLDRVKNRLLAGLEFHYENSIINPLNREDLTGETILIRDVEKEDEILKHMELSSFAKTDSGYFLHNEMLEYEFLYHIVPKLQKLVQIYATTAVRNRIFRGNAHPQVRVKVKKQRINWLEFKFEMDGIPEKQIKDVLSALEEKRKYYRLNNGSLLSLESREMQEIQRFLHMPYLKNKELANGLEIPIERSLQLLDNVTKSDMFLLEESFRELLDILYHPGRLAFEVPKKLEPILRDYQKIGYSWMKTLASYGFGGILADDMGLGKTIQSIAFILSGISDIRQNKLPVLIVCPSSLMYNWLHEMNKFAPDLQAIVIDGNQKERSKLHKALKDIDVLITSYPLLRRDIKWFEQQAFYTVFFDEAQAFKNPLTQTARAVKRLQVNYRFALTGTPIENSREDLWSIFHVIFPELFGGLKEYSKLTKEKIARRSRPFILRRMKEEVLSELPEKTESMEAVDMFPEQKKLYAAYLAKLRHDTLKHLDMDTIRKNRIKILAGITRLRQICCHPGLFVEGYQGSSAKLEQLFRIVEESKLSGRRLLIFSQFTKMLELMGRELTKRGLSFFYLDGQTPPEERVTICNRYNAGERDFFLISLKAGGTGLNLMTADTVILYDSWWNPAVEEQAADRAHRMGQKNKVQVIKLVARGTIEEKMNELQQQKRNLIEEIIDTEDKMLTSLTEEDIREIFMI